MWVRPSVQGCREISTLDRYRLGHSPVRNVQALAPHGAGLMFSRSPVSESELVIWKKVVPEKGYYRNHISKGGYGYLF